MSRSQNKRSILYICYYNTKNSLNSSQVEHLSPTILPWKKNNILQDTQKISKNYSSQFTGASGKALLVPFVIKFIFH